MGLQCERDIVKGEEHVFKPHTAACAYPRCRTASGQIGTLLPFDMHNRREEKRSQTDAPTAP